MSNRLGFIVVFILVMIILSACGGDQNRPNDAQPLDANIPSEPTVSSAVTVPVVEPVDTPSAESTVPPPPVGTPQADTVESVSTPEEPDSTPEEPDSTPGSQLESTTDTILTFKISGGIVSFCDELTINGNGEFSLLACNQSDSTQGVLEQPDRISLQAWHDNLANFQTVYEDNPDGADNLSTELIFNGRGQVEADENQQQVILDWVNGLTLRLRMPQEQAAPAPSPTPEAVAAIGAAGVLCPDINRPALLTLDFNNPNTLTVIDPDSQLICNITLNQPSFGRITSAAGNIYYPVFDPDSQTMTVWKVGAGGDQTPLDFTSVAMPEPAPFDFVLSDDGSKIAWSWTFVDFESDPPLYRNNLRTATVDGNNLVTIFDQTENAEGRFVAPVQFSANGNTLFYTLQPDIGGPVFSGRYDTLYGVPVTGGQTQLLYGCPAEENPVCIGGITLDGSAVTIIQPQAGTIEVLNREGGVIGTLALPATDYVERTAFSPNGNMVFLSATLFQTAQGEPPRPNPGYISFVAPPYADQPQTLLSNNSVGTLRGWLDEDRIVFGSLDEAGNTITTLVNLKGEVTELSPNVAVGVLK